MRVLLLGWLMVSAISGAQERGPILLSPMTPEEQEATKAELRERLADDGWTDVEIDEAIALQAENSDDPPKTFQEKDVLSFFPEISESDVRAHACFVQLRSPPSQTYTYYSEPVGNERAIETKTLDCDIEQAGMFCELSTETALFLDAPTDFFFIDDTIEEEAARRIASMYRDKMGTSGDLNRISKRGEDYLLGLGRDGCACSGERTVRTRTFLSWTWLDFTDSGTDTCI